MPLIIIDVVCLQKLPVLILKRNGLMMFGLVLNIFHNGIGVFGAYAEPTVTGLPLKFTSGELLFVDPCGGPTFEVLHELCIRHILGGFDQQMYMVGHSVDGNGNGTLVLCNAKHVGVDSLSHVLWDKRFTILCREDDVSKVGVEGLRHGCGGVYPASLQDAIVCLVWSQD